MEQTVERKTEFNRVNIKGFFDRKEPVYADGYFDIKSKLPKFEDKDFTHVSNRLLNEYGYFLDGEIRLCLFVDLLVQARTIVLNTRKHGYLNHYVYTGEIMIPSGKTREIFIVSNEHGKSTIKLATDA